MDQKQSNPLSAKQIESEVTKGTYKVSVFSELPSTNAVLKGLAGENAPAGTVIVADRQTAGRGRLRRSFFSPPGAGIYMSVLLRPRIPAERAGLITAFASVAVARALEKTCGLSAGIKWVNDLWCGRRKLCGILTEAGIDQGGGIEYAVLGIGLNTAKADLPPELAETVTSVEAETGRAPDRNLLIAAILSELARIDPEAPDPSLLREYTERSILPGKRILVCPREGESFEATAVGFDETAGLILDVNGNRQVLTTGEVSVRPMADKK